ncbi:hypothetical protein AOQ84DRAFT_258549, partial [Glonium stellatum]
GGRGPPPEVPWPWQAQWDGDADRWVFVNGETGERRWDAEGLQVGEAGLGNAWRNEEGRMDRRWDNSVQDVEDVPEDAARWAGRKVGAAFLSFSVYSSQDISDLPQDVAYGAERRYDNAVQDVEDVPDDVAGFVGRRVGDVERFDGRVERRWDDGVERVEEAPERLADDVGGFFGRKEEEVERFGEGVDGAYDQGRYEGRGDRW